MRASDEMASPEAGTAGPNGGLGSYAHQHSTRLTTEYSTAMLVQGRAMYEHTFAHTHAHTHTPTHAPATQQQYVDMGMKGPRMGGDSAAIAPSNGIPAVSLGMFTSFSGSATPVYSASGTPTHMYAHTHVTAGTGGHSREAESRSVSVASSVLSEPHLGSDSAADLASEFASLSVCDDLRAFSHAHTPTLTHACTLDTPTAISTAPPSASDTDAGTPTMSFADVSTDTWPMSTASMESPHDGAHISGGTPHATGHSHNATGRMRGSVTALPSGRLPADAAMAGHPRHPRVEWRMPDGVSFPPHARVPAPYASVPSIGHASSRFPSAPGPFEGMPAALTPEIFDAQLAHAMSTSLRVFVGKLSGASTTESIKAYFIGFLAYCGYPAPEKAVCDVYAPLDVHGRPRGFAFVSFADRKTVDMVMGYPQHFIDGRQVLLDVAAPRGFKVDPKHALPYAAGHHNLAGATGPGLMLAGGHHARMPREARYTAPPMPAPPRDRRQGRHSALPYHYKSDARLGPHGWYDSRRFHGSHPDSPASYGHPPSHYPTYQYQTAGTYGAAHAHADMIPPHGLPGGMHSFDPVYAAHTDGFGHQRELALVDGRHTAMNSHTDHSQAPHALPFAGDRYDPPAPEARESESQPLWSRQPPGSGAFAASYRNE